MSFKNISFYFFNICIFLFLIYLAVWQVNRLDYKKKILEEIESNINLSPVEFVQNKESFYKKVTLTGRYLFDQKIFYYAPKNGKNGFNVLIPFKTEKGDFLVSRDWVEHKKDFIISKEDAAPKNLTAFVLEYPRKNLAIVKNDKKNNIWFNLFYDEIRQDIKVTPYFLVALKENDKDINRNYKPEIKNDHFAYAVTWFSLAFIHLCFFIIGIRKRMKNIK